MEDTNTDTVRIDGRTIVLPENRELDRLTALIEARGAVTLRCPLLSMVPPADWGPADDFLRILCDGGIDLLIFFTGEGVNRLHARAQTRGVQEAWVDGLKQVQIITRGPKPGAALKAIGVQEFSPVAIPTTTGIIQALKNVDLVDKNVGVQLFGDQGNPELLSFLHEKGAAVRTAVPYIYAPPSDEARIASVIDEMKNGNVDAIAFTSAAQVDRLFELATRRGWLGDLKEGLATTLVACIGPVAAEALEDRGIAVSLQLDAPFVFERLCGMMAAAMAQTD